MDDQDNLDMTNSGADQRVSPAVAHADNASDPVSVSEAGSSAPSRKVVVGIAAVVVVVALALCVLFGLGSGPSLGNQANAPDQNVSAEVGNQSAENQAADAAESEQHQPQEASGDDSLDGSDGGSSTAPSSSSAPAGSSGSESSGSQSSSSSAPEAAPAPATITVSVYVDSSRASGYPACMASTSVTVPEGSSVYDALVATGVSIGGGPSYVRSINGLKEKLPGYEATSGWMYSVNGGFPNASCGSYILSGGESIRWSYTLNMGKDL